MATRFRTFMKELAREAKAEGPEAVAELRLYRERFRQARAGFSIPPRAPPSDPRRP